MKIVMITGSAHKKGTSASLADAFIRGAEEAGHEVFRFDAAFKNVHPCIGCEKCHNTETGCAFPDDMTELNPKLLASDAVVFVSPIYYYGLSAQLAAVLDRFYANDDALHAPKKTALMVTMAEDDPETAAGAVATFKGNAGYLGWEIAGTVIGQGCGSVEELEKKDFLQQAYELGKSM